jgi:hypothetical protein
MRHLTEVSAIQILTKHHAKVDLANKVVRDANFLGNRLNSVVDYLVRNHRWSRTIHTDALPKKQCSEMLL